MGDMMEEGAVSCSPLTENYMAQLVYREVQPPYLWVRLLLVVVGLLPILAVLSGEPAWPGLLPSGVALLLLLLFIPHTIELQHRVLRVSFGLLRLVSWTFPLQDIEKAEAVTYLPFKSYLGWGIRRGRDKSLGLTMRGNRGVMLQLRDGRRVLVGSQQPDDLVLAINGS